MKNKELLRKLRDLGYPLFETEEKRPGVNLTLAEVVQSKDTRLWEGFPLLLANSLKQGLFNYDEVMKLLKKTSDKKAFRRLILISLALYKVLNVKFSWTNNLFEVAGFSSSELKEAYQDLRKMRNKVMYTQMSLERLKNTFRNYFRQEQGKLAELESLKEEFSLEYALSQVFSPKQKELFFKRLRGERMTKTEREYYSRVVRKKVEALANPELHRLAQNIK